MEEDLLDKINQVESQESKSKGFKWIMIVLGIVLLIVVCLFVVSYLREDLFGSSFLNFSDSSQEDVNENLGISDLNEGVNETLVDDVNQTGLNEINVEGNNSVLDNGVVPNPNGSIKMLKIRGGDGEYYCDNVTSPEHGIRLYTYKLVEGVKTQSEEYIDSEKISNVCSYYDNSSWGMNYYFKWSWSLVDGVDGYRIYQYYVFNTTNRNYSYYVDMNADANLLTDLGLDFWTSV